MLEIISNAKAHLTESLDWVREGAGGSLAQSRLSKDIKKTISKLSVASDALAGKPTVAVYGESQSGKSYLTAALAKNTQGVVLTKFCSREFNFISDINPPGGKESTALVTRFTKDELSTDSDFPIQLKLFSFSDLIKVFSNSFAFDLEPNVDATVDSIAQVLDEKLNQLENSLEPRNDNFRFDAEDLYSIEDYCDQKFLFHPHFQAIKQIDFWNRAEKFLGKGLKSSKSLFRLLWNDEQRYSDYFEALVSELSKFGFPNFVSCSMPALFEFENDLWKRSNTSILNVACLTQGDLLVDLSIKLSNNNIVSTTNRKLCALGYEMSMPLVGVIDQIFNEVDVLDFPGARSRKPQSRKSFINEGAAEPLDNFLRGKISFLFDKYSSEFSISSLLLCVGPSNQNVVGLERLIEDWIANSHGLRPDSRAGKPVTLFLILTKFDMEFSNAQGIQVTGERFDIRLRASLEEPFGGRNSSQTNWVYNWADGRNFKKAFWLRNPNAGQSSIIEYMGELDRSLEKRVRPDRVEFIGKLREGFLQSNAARYFENPVRAWDEALSMNDGGASFVLESIRNVVGENLLFAQVGDSVRVLIENRIADLKPLYFNTEHDELKVQQKEKAEIFLRKCAHLLEKKRLGEFISQLYLSDFEVMRLFHNAKRGYERSTTIRQIKAEPFDDESILIPEIREALGLSVSYEKPLKNVSAENFADFFCDYLFNYWKEKTSNLFTGTNLASYLYIDRDFVVSILSELELFAVNAGFKKDLAAVITSAYQVVGGDQNSTAWRLASRTSALFNQFIERGGVGGVGPVEILTLIGSSKTIFCESTHLENSAAVEDPAGDLINNCLLDWVFAVQNTILQNANPMRFSEADLQRNTQLRKILDDLIVVHQRVCGEVA